MSPVFTALRKAIDKAEELANKLKADMPQPLTPEVENTIDGMVTRSLLRHLLDGRRDGR